MKHIFAFIVSVLNFVSLVHGQAVTIDGASGEVTKRKSKPDMHEYSLVKVEDFNSRTLNQFVWDYRKEGLKEQGTFYRKANAKIENGILHLITDYSQGSFSGVSISTEKQSNYHFRYGYFEIRASLPQTRGNGAAFWMQSQLMGETRPTVNPSLHGVEIDMLEYSATTPDMLFHSLHWNGYDMARGARQVTQNDLVPGISKGFHRFGFEWTPREYVIYVDGVEKVRTSNTISHTKEFMVLGCGTGGFGGPLNTFGPWPDTFSIDYVKFYKRKPEVSIYGDCDGYGWVSEGLQPGSYTRAELEARGVLNDAASSIEVPKGWRLVAFADDNFKGDQRTITSDIACLQEQTFNDKISSVRIISNKK